MANQNIKNHEITLTLEQLDFFKELGNIGSGNAATALSNLINKELRISLTSVGTLPFWKLPDIFNRTVKKFYAIYSSVKIPEKITLLNVIEKEALNNVLNKIDNSINNGKLDEYEEIKDLDETTLNLILEIFNIISGNYISAVANLLNLKLVPKLPKIVIETLPNIMKELVSKQSETLEYIIYMKTKIIGEDFECDFILGLFPISTLLNNLFNNINISQGLKFE